MKTLFILILIMLTTTTLAQSSGVPDTRLANLGKGINLSHWWAQSITGQYDDARLKSYITPADFVLIRQMGFNHVRFTVNCAVLLDEANPGVLNAGKLALFDEALAAMLDHDLAVVVDVHPEDEFKARLKAEPKLADGFVAFWGALAKHVAGSDPERVLLEVLNEPNMKDSGYWRALQAKTLAAMREGAPNHTLIATPDAWSGIDMLEKFEPYDDPNILYTFHDYEPHNFTHQGASWGWDMWKNFKNLPYPSSPEAVEKVINQQEGDEAKKHVRYYGEMRWNLDKQRELIDRAVAWADKHNVKLYCGEFGAYRKFSQPEDRARFLSDLVAALKERNIPWAMWDYCGGFSVVNGGKSGQRTPDEMTVKAIGLVPTKP